MSTPEAWEQLRASRWSPPGRADSGSRRNAYAAALEQAEQTFQAAAAVGTATRPIQVFYGLSQAGRAIAAAAVVLKGKRSGTSHPTGSRPPGSTCPSRVSRSAPTRPAPRAAS
ncbi:YaaC family protein [Streptomyces werraensis]|uniref:YaaC family protein n=1 Tax=Streptomyces werraensis TaxID=68284 RepID=UPI00380FE23A